MLVDVFMVHGDVQSIKINKITASYKNDMYLYTIHTFYQNINFSILICLFVPANLWNGWTQF